ncbi:MULTISPECIES: hypothetical protein [unclassified Caballeronia]|uniref:hypothetical protein n=1 Tax=unclassified Caballeronia TaxID=2646786 RepID=UPI0028554FCC|nr:MULTISPECIES: hypothetical protein [unclassified Caballeronia]MDR5752696.1 hypothetical protein [Caballeronia sp. LZ024]MDR5841338.1 hypothetical protein [Caballeronia sp. LZ031]
MQYLQRRAIEILDDIVKRGESAVDELAKVLADRLASVPVGDTETAYRIFGEAVEAARWK